MTFWEAVGFCAKWATAISVGAVILFLAYVIIVHLFHEWVDQ